MAYNKNVLRLSSGGYKSDIKMSAELSSLCRLWGRMWFQAFLEASRIASQPWHPLACSCSPTISASTLTWLSLLLHLSDDGLLLPGFLSSLLLIRTPVTLDKGPTLLHMTPSDLITSTKIVFPNKATYWGSRAFHLSLGGRQFSWSQAVSVQTAKGRGNTS